VPGLSAAVRFGSDEPRALGAGRDMPREDPRARASMPMNCAARAFCARPSSGAVMRRTDAQGTFSSKHWSSKRTAQDAGDSRTDRTSPGSHRAPPCQQAITRAPARRRGAASSRVAQPSIAASVPGCTVRSGSPAARVASLSTDAGTSCPRAIERSRRACHSAGCCCTRLRYSSVRFGPLSPRPLTQMCLLHSRRVGPVTPAPKVSPYSGVATSLTSRWPPR